jgi:hypothetical protein
VNFEDHAFHGAGEMVGVAEVSSKSDDPGHGLPDVSAGGGGKSMQEKRGRPGSLPHHH